MAEISIKGEYFMIMTTYETFRENKDILTFEEAIDIHSQIIHSANTTDRDFKELLEDLIGSAIIYADFRARWSLMDFDERKKIGASRSLQHNAYMSNLEIVARYMKHKGWDSDWINKLGTKENDRKRLGDFACYLVCINAVSAR